MKGIIDPLECQRDTPKFRQVLDQNEKELNSFEMKLEKIVKQCSQMVHAGRQYNFEQDQLVCVLWDMAGHFRNDTIVQASLNKLLTALGEAVKYQSILVDQAARAIAINMTTFIKTDLRETKEMHDDFEKMSNELDNVLHRSAALLRNKPADVEDMNKQVISTRRAFRHTAIDYVHKISIAQAKKRCNVVDALLSYTKAYRTYFHQGTDLCDDLKRCLETMALEVTEMRTQVEDLQHCHSNWQSSVVTDDLVQCDAEEDCLQPSISGYLFKRANNAFKTWNRRYFSLMNNQLVYRKRSGEEVTVMEEDLRLCSVKSCNDADRRFCFELLSPTKSHLLQADSEESCNLWISTLKRGISVALQGGQSFSSLSQKNSPGTPSTHASALSTPSNGSTTSFYSPLPSSLSHSSSNVLCNPSPESSHDDSRRSSLQTLSKQELWASVLSVAGNNFCCDCGASSPKWASANLGITLCIECSGIHRSLGVHYSRVKSLTLDDWEPAVLKLLLELGNKTVNDVYCHLAPQGLIPATPTSSREEREAWIRAKYVQKLFVKPLPATLPSNLADSEATFERTTWNVSRRCRFRSSTQRTVVPASALLHDTDRSPEHSRSNSSVPDLLTLSPVVLLGDSEEQESVPENLRFLLDEQQDEVEDVNAEEMDSIAEPFSNFSVRALLSRASRAHNLPLMCHALALNASINDLYPDGEAGAAPLHHAVWSGSASALEYLLLNGAAPNVTDKAGRSALHVSVLRGSIFQVYRLLQHRSTDLYLKDSDGSTPLDLALQHNQPDLVALLRVAGISEDIDRDEVDALMQAIVSDFAMKMRKIKLAK